MFPRSPSYNDSQVPGDTAIPLQTLPSNLESSSMVKDSVDEPPSDTTPLQNHVEVHMASQERDDSSETASRARLRWWKRPNLAWYENDIFPGDVQYEFAAGF